MPQYCKRNKTRNDSKTSDKHAADCSKSGALVRKVINVRCIKCSYSNIPKSIRLLNKIVIFVYIGKNSHK